MSEKKDYLSMLADEANEKNKPASFQEEKFERVSKPKMSFDPKIIIGSVVALLVVAVAVYFFFFSPKISMPDFEGKTKNDVGVWLKQEGLSSSDVIMVDEYNFDFEEGQIFKQSKEAGSKVKKGNVITFNVSKGANPDEKVTMIDLNNSDLTEIQKWINDNKLQKTKVSQAYSTTVEKDSVISYDLKNVDEKDFTRGTTLTINVSKGPQPAQEVTVTDFLKKSKIEAESWAKTNKLEFDAIEQYSDTIEAGQIISQSHKADSKITQGSTFTVYVSKGKAVTMPDLSTYSQKKANEWCATVSGCEMYTRYDRNIGKGGFISQSVAAGRILENDAKISIVFSLGKPDLSTFNGSTFDDLQTWVNDLNENGDAQMPNPKAVWEYSDLAYGTIIRINNKDLTVGATVEAVVSQGKNILVSGTVPSNETDARSFCNTTELTCKFEYETAAGAIGDVIGMSVNGVNFGPGATINQYIPQKDTVVFKIVEKN